MFSLLNQQSQIAHINVRQEKHGEEQVTALDIKVVVDVPNDFLSYLDPTLKWSLYTKTPGQDDLIEDKTHLPHLRYGAITDLKWHGSMEKAAVTLHGAKRSHDIELEADVDKLVLSPRDGGTVGISFRVQVRPDPGMVAKIIAMLGIECKVTVTPHDEEAATEAASDLAGSVIRKAAGNDD